MTIKIRPVLSVVILLHFGTVLNPSLSYPQEKNEEKEEVSPSVGSGKAIAQADKKKGFQLSQSAIRTIGLKFLTIKNLEDYQLPAEALVRFQEEFGVYRFRNGWFRLVEIRPVFTTKSHFTTRTNEIQANDQIVIDGVPLLRVAELEVLGGTGDGDGH